MANPSVQQDKMGPDWPLGFIKVVTPGVPVGIMSLVDPQGVNDPSTVQSNQGSSGTSSGVEFPLTCFNIMFQASKPGAAHGTQSNTGNIYILRKGVQGDGSRDDTGSIIYTVPQTDLGMKMLFPFGSPGIRFSPYRYFIDADNANDGAFFTLYLPS